MFLIYKPTIFIASKFYFMLNKKAQSEKFAKSTILWKVPTGYENDIKMSFDTT